MDACIKNIDKADWNYIKAEAARNDMTMGKFLGLLVKKYKISGRRYNNWGSILGGKRFLSKKEARELEKASASFRKSFSFR